MAGATGSLVGGPEVAGRTLPSHLREVREARQQRRERRERGSGERARRHEKMGVSGVFD